MASLLGDIDVLIDHVDKYVFFDSIREFAKKHLYHTDIKHKYNGPFKSIFKSTYQVTWISEEFNPDQLYDIYGFGDKYVELEDYQITKIFTRLYIDEDNNIVPYTHMHPIFLINYKEDTLPFYIKIKSENPINVIALNCNENLKIEGVNILFCKTYDEF